MSSAITYEWFYKKKYLEQILREKKEFFKEKMNEAIKDVIKLISTHKNKFKNINTSGEKLPPYLRLPEKAIAYSLAIKVGK